MDPGKTSFRQLTEIERIVCSEFKKVLRTKHDKGFKNSKSYNTSYHSFANKPIPIESVMTEMLFHYYKTLVDIANHNTKDNFEWEEFVTLEIYGSTTKELLANTWDDFRYYY